MKTYALVFEVEDNNEEKALPFIQKTSEEVCKILKRKTNGEIKGKFEKVADTTKEEISALLDCIAALRLQCGSLPPMITQDLIDRLKWSIS